MSAPNVMTLFRQWEATTVEAGSPTISEAEADQLFSICGDLGRAMLAQPTADIRDFAAKVLACSRYGEFALSEGLIEEAKTIVGEEAPLQAVKAARATL